MKYNCQTCAKKYIGYDKTKHDFFVGGSFYATNDGIMFCEIDRKPIPFSIYLHNMTHGCASHSEIDYRSLFL